MLVEIAKSRLAPPQQFVLPLALADIQSEHENLGWLAGFVGYGRHDLTDPDRLPVLVNVSALNLDGVHFAVTQAAISVNIVIPIIGMNEGTEMHTAQLVFGIADEGAESGVALLEPPVPIR